MPEDVDPFEFFGFEGVISAFWGDPRVPVNLSMCPGFQVITLEETQEYRIYRAGDGVITKARKDVKGYPTYQWLEYPIKNRDDWEKFMEERLDPEHPARYPEESQWEKMKAEWKDRDYPISIDGGSFYGFARNWIGVHNISLLFYDDPDLLHEMMDYLADFFIKVLHRAVHEVDVDFALFWEDMCYKSGPLISPTMFREFMLHNYRKVTSFLVDHGVELSWVDCDGNIDELVPLWIEGGVTGFYPLEVAAGMDAGKLRDQYGQEIVMWGNVDKRALVKGRDAIDAEIDRLKPVVEKGGFIPLVDHGVPEDISYQNYLYYLQRRKEITGYNI
jgi:uroporphyrinogen decarboxylase